MIPEVQLPAGVCVCLHGGSKDPSPVFFAPSVPALPLVIGTPKGYSHGPQINNGNKNLIPVIFCLVIHCRLCSGPHWYLRFVSIPLRGVGQSVTRETCCVGRTQLETNLTQQEVGPVPGAGRRVCCV